MIETFWEEITRQKEITQGTHFNLNHLIAAYQAYIVNYDTLANRDNRNLFWDQVIGYVQRQMTTYDAQIHCSGIWSVLVYKGSFSRNLEADDGVKFFPLSRDSGLGFDFGFSNYYNGRHWFWRPRYGGHDAAVNGTRSSKKYLEQKQKHLQDLESHLSKECVISQGSCIFC